MTKFTELNYSGMTIEEINASFGMFSVEGAKEVKELVESVKTLPVSMTDEELYKVLKHGMKGISKIGHGEVYDTEVRQRIIGEIERATKRELSIFEIYK